VTLEELSEEALIRIMKEPKNALIKQYQKLFEIDGVNLEIEDAAIEAVAKKALDRKTGARGLRSIFEKTMTDIMFEIPSRDDIAGCVVTEDTITKETEPKLIIGEKKKKISDDANNEADAS
jgi:ATP-dependent Clp protease ATP-binding subunit ClpX